MIKSRFKEVVPLILFGLAAVLVFWLTTFNTGLRMVKADTSGTSVYVGNATPTMSISLNSGSAITLNEGTWKSVSTTITVTDLNGCDTITGVTSTLFWALTNTASSTSCTYNGETCYPITSDINNQACTATTTGNTCAGGTDTTVEYDCGFHVWYIATSTDSVASYIWSIAATTTDSYEARGTASNTAEKIEINAASYLNVTANINYGSLSASQTTGATNQETTVTATGNYPIDNQIYATDNGGDSATYMCVDYATCSGNKFGVWMQQYKLSSFTYADSPANTCLTGTTTPTLELVIEKPRATTTPDQTDIVYWGIGIPAAQPAGTYTGSNTFAATADY